MHNKQRFQIWGGYIHIYVYISKTCFIRNLMTMFLSPNEAFFWGEGYWYFINQLYKCWTDCQPGKDCQYFTQNVWRRLYQESILIFVIRFERQVQLSWCVCYADSAQVDESTSPFIIREWIQEKCIEDKDIRTRYIR